jgi:hypothetical protein
MRHITQNLARSNRLSLGLASYPFVDHAYAGCIRVAPDREERLCLHSTPCRHCTSNSPSFGPNTEASHSVGEDQSLVIIGMLRAAHRHVAALQERDLQMRPLQLFGACRALPHRVCQILRRPGCVRSQPQGGS